MSKFFAQYASGFIAIGRVFGIVNRGRKAIEAKGATIGPKISRRTLLVAALYAERTIALNEFVSIKPAK